MADRDLNPERLQAAHIGAVRGIAAAHDIAETVQDFGNTAHADAANADEMQRADIDWECPHAAFSRGSLARAQASTRSARRKAASGTPSWRAAAAAPTSVSGVATNDASFAARVSGVKSRSGITQAAPVSPSARALKL